MSFVLIATDPVTGQVTRTQPLPVQPQVQPHAYLQGGYVYNNRGDLEVAAQPVQNLGTRTRQPTQFYDPSAPTVPGANNGYTAGRQIDPYDRGYNGSTGQG
jgi:hypothetical protein